MTEFKDIFAKIGGGKLEPDHIEGLFKQIDTDNVGSITFDQFFAYLFPK